MFAAYLDETGHAKDPKRKCVGFGALLAEAGAWVLFESRWKALCQQFGIGDSFHMTDFAARVALYKTWSEPTRQEFLQQALEIIGETNPMPIGAVVSLADFQSLHPKQQSKFIDPYYVALQECASQIAVTALLMGEPDINDPGPVHMTIAEHPEFKQAMELWDAMRRYTFTGFVLHSCSFATPSKVLPLQAADIWAYELGHHFEHILPKRKAHRWPFQQFMQLAQRNTVRSRFFTFFDREELLERLGET